MSFSNILKNLFKIHGNKLYTIGEPITQKSHAIQSAMMAEKLTKDNEVIIKECDIPCPKNCLTKTYYEEECPLHLCGQTPVENITKRKGGIVINQLEIGEGEPCNTEYLLDHNQIQKINCADECPQTECKYDFNKNVEVSPDTKPIGF